MWLLPLLFCSYNFTIAINVRSVVADALFCIFGLLGEYHGNNPEMSKLLHKAVRQKSENAYSIYQQHLANRPVNVSFSLTTLFHLFDICFVNFSTSMSFCLKFLIYTIFINNIFFRFSVIFWSLRVVGHQFQLAKLNLQSPLSSASALVECLLELFQEKHMKQLQLQWTD